MKLRDIGCKELIYLLSFQNHKCIFVNVRVPLNIYELIFDEARLRLRNTNRSLSNDDQDLLRHIVFKYSKLLPELLESSPKPRRKMALDEAASEDTRRSRSQRGRGRGRGRSRGRGRGRGRGDSNRGNRSQGQADFRGGSRGGNFHGNYSRYRSRDSSTESRDGQHSKERNFGSSWRQRRDSSIDGRGTQDKNWRSGPRSFDKTGEQKLNHHRDSSSSSVDSRSDHVRKHDNRYHISRTHSLSSITSTSDVPRSFGGGRTRTESNSSIGSDTRRDWKEGCLGGGPRNNNNNERNWQVDEGRKLELNLGEMQTNNTGSWRGAEGGRKGFQRSLSYERREGRQYKVCQDSGNRSSSVSHYRGQRDALAASTTRASPGESEGSGRKFHRGGIRVKETNFQMSWRHSEN